MVITRVTLSLDSEDVELLDRLAVLRALNRSEQFREILARARPMLRQTVEVLEGALEQRDAWLNTFTEVDVLGMEDLMEEVDRVQNAVLGSMSRIEGAAAAREASDPRASNHGGQVPNPPTEESTE